MRHTDYFSPFFGIDGGGNCLCGPYLPFGIARPGPDTTIPHPPNGYRSGDRIIRFSQNHVSGTGGGGRYGNLGLTPYICRKDCKSGYLPENEEAKAGYYSVEFPECGIKTELTCTSRTAIHRYHFSNGAEHGVLLDAGSIIMTGMDNDKPPCSIGGVIEIVSDNEIVGRADCKGGWGHNYPYSIYFSMQCNQPIREYELKSESQDIAEDNCACGQNIKVWLEYGNVDSVEIRIGISYVSIANAKQSIERETASKTFEQLVSEAKDIWKNQLKKITVEEGTEEDKKLFYSAFARLLCMPGDLGVDDENPWWHSNHRQFTDFYCLWDSVRNANSLLMLIEPQLSTDMMNSLLDIADHTGWITDAWIAGHSAQIQGGCSADVLFTEFAGKDIPDINYSAALKQMVKTRCQQPSNPRLFGRYLEHYRNLGYVSTETPQCTSRHIEYAWQDHCAAELAKIMDNMELENDFRKDSEKIWNLWRDDLKCFAPKNSDGSWVEPFDPWKPTRPDYWYDPYFYEGTAAEWSLCALHVIDKIIEKHGGKAAFERYLDYFFEHIFIWKEIILHTPYLYHLVDRPDKTADTVNRMLRMKYHAGRDGLSDNDDMGANSAFIMCSMLGIYPMAGQTRYMLSTPYFRFIRFELGEGKILTITTDHSNTTHPYVKSIHFNGIRQEKPWMDHKQLMTGGELRFSLSSERIGYE